MDRKAADMGAMVVKTNCFNRMVLKDAKSKKKNLSTAWTDYKKAFDSAPHA